MSPAKRRARSDRHRAEVEADPRRRAAATRRRRRRDRRKKFCSPAPARVVAVRCARLGARGASPISTTSPSAMQRKHTYRAGRQHVTACRAWRTAVMSLVARPRPRGVRKGTSVESTATDDVAAPCASTAERSPAASYGARRALMSGRWSCAQPFEREDVRAHDDGVGLVRRAMLGVDRATIASACACCQRQRNGLTGWQQGAAVLTALRRPRRLRDAPSEKAAIAFAV